MKDLLTRLRGVFVLAAILGLFGWVWCDEFIYLWSGIVVEARLLRTYETVERVGRGHRTYLKVEYVFQEAGGAMRLETDKLSTREAKPEGPTIAVKYVPGKRGMSRLASQPGFSKVIIFVAGFAFFAWRAYALSDDAPHPKRQAGIKQTPGD